MEIFMQLIQQVGFPIFVAVYLLHSYRKKLDEFHVEQARTNLLLAVLVKSLARGDTEVPQEIIDEVSAVLESPLPGTLKLPE